MPIHQVVVGAAVGDAITSMALNIRDVLCVSGESKIFAVFPDSSVLDEVHPIHELSDEDDSKTLIYHSSYGVRELTARLVCWKGDLVLQYHNVTPDHFFEDIDSEFAEGLRWGKKELEVLRPKVVKAFADSTFNASDLLIRGYQDVEVLPTGVDSQKLVDLAPDIRIANYYRHLFPNGYVIAVSQLLPHKRMELAVAAVHQVRELWGIDLGLVIVGIERSGTYSGAVRAYAERLLGGGFRMTGRLNDRQLSTLLRHATMYLGMSEHEGLSIPLIDSMALGVPAIVRNVGAVAETCGDGAVLVEHSAGASEIAKTIADIARDTSIRTALIGRGFERAKSFEKNLILNQFSDALSKVLK